MIENESLLYGAGDCLAFTLNRDAANADRYQLPADGWFQIARYSEVSKDLERDGKKPVKIVQVFDEPAADAIVARFQRWAKTQNFGGLLVDFDHFSSDQEKSTRAAAWIIDVAKRPDGLWAQMRFSTSGRASVEGGDYRHFSPVLGFEPRDYQAGERARPAALLGGALTNQPTFKGMVPLSNRQTATTAERGEIRKIPTMKSVLKKLGLAEDASEESAVAALDRTMNRAAQADAFETENATLRTAQIEADLDKYSLNGAAREKAKALLTKNRAEGLAFLEALGGEGSGYAVTHNRKKAKTPAGKKTDEPEQSLDQQRDAAVRDYRTRNRWCSFQEAWDATRSEKPELFADAKEEGAE